MVVTIEGGEFPFSDAPSSPHMPLNSPGPPVIPLEA